MSVDHSADLVVGYVIPLESFFEKLLKHHPEKSHKEDRFDPKSGKKIEPETVIDEDESYDVVICGKAYPGPEVNYDPENWWPEDAVTDAIAEALDCYCSVIGDMYNGCCVFVCLESRKISTKDDAVSLKDIIKHVKDLERIGKACKRLLKVDPGVCGAHAVMSVC